MWITAQQVVGRDEELGAVVGLFDARERLAGAVVLRGEAGIGKTTLWLAGIDAAAARGYRVLASRPSEAETRSSFVGLTDLLEKSVGDFLPELPPIQRRALEAALLLGDSEMPADDRTVSAAFLRALRLLARDTPVCVAVDDIQWLDAASLTAFRYVLARLEDAQVAVLLTVRGDVPAWVRRGVPEDRLKAVEVDGLSLGALHELLGARLGATFPRPTLVRLWETSRGNPFLALELGAALRGRGGALDFGGEFPIPTGLEELLDARVDGLGAGALEVARTVGALASPSVSVVEAAVGGPGFDAGLAQALRARILELDRERLRFTHPLLASAVAARQTPAQRRSLHARLAEIVSSAEDRARHLALATIGPDAAVASILEEAAETVRAGAPAGAAELAEEALRLTPPTSPGDSRRRLLAAADLYSRAGDPDRAVALLENALSAAAPGADRATVQTHLARVHFVPSVSVPLYREALVEAGDDDALQATIHLGLASALRWGEGAEQAFEHATLAVLAATRAGDEALRCRALAAHGELHMRSGRGIPVEEMEEALAIERSLPGWPLSDGPTWSQCDQLCWTANVGRAREFLRTLRIEIETQDDPYATSLMLWFWAFNEWRAGDWEEAERYATASVDLDAQLGPLIAPSELPAAILAAHRGRLDDVRARVARSLARAEATGFRIAESAYGWVLGFVELSLGNAPAALGYLRPAYELRNAFMVEPATRLELGDLLEALIATGELQEANEIIAVWEERARRLDRAWALAILARARGLLQAARGDRASAFASFDRALGEHHRSADPFQHARTLLALGRTQRRAKRRGAARATFEEALAAFEHLGAPLWAEQTRAEIARIGGRAPSRGDLTEAERRIAGLVAEGRSNRDVAAALFLTQHSVETALTRIYRKLGVRSRAELAHLFASKS